MARRNMNEVDDPENDAGEFEDEIEDDLEPEDEDLEPAEDDLEAGDEALDEDEDVAGEPHDAAEADESEDDESLDQILNQRSAARAGKDDDGDREDADILAFSGDRDDTVSGELRTRVKPMRDTQEFVCKRCHLVKARSQLADASRQLCRDCV